MTKNPTSDPDRSSQRSRLLGVKLRALVADHLADGLEVGAPAEFGPGAALVAGGTAWVLLDDQAGPRLGAALAWALRQQASSLAVIASGVDHAVSDAGVVARRAEEFSFPIDVFVDEGRNLVEVEAAPGHPSLEVPGHHQQFEATIVEGGAVPLVEHGVLTGEVRGLEVCRVVDDTANGTTRLEVGTGAHDREAFSMLHGDTPTSESLKRIVDTVAQHRADGAAPHPLNRLAKERLLRDRVIGNPRLLGNAGVVSLRPAEPPVPRPNLKDAVPAVAVGEDDDGTTVVVAVAVGVDLELVPFAADARRAIDTAARLIICTPARDQLPVIADLNTQLRRPALLASI